MLMKVDEGRSMCTQTVSAIPLRSEDECRRRAGEASRAEGEQRRQHAVRAEEQAEVQL